STSSTPRACHGSRSGSLMADTLMSRPFTTRVSPLASTVPGKRPCTESYLSRCARVLVSVMSLTATNSRAGCCISIAARTTFRPMRPNPLIPTRTAIALPQVKSGTTARPKVTPSTVAAPALIVAPLPLPGGAQRDGNEACGLAVQHVEVLHRRHEVVGDPRQAAVLQGVHGGARPSIEPDRRADYPQRRGPVGAQPARPEVRLRLAAAPAPRRPYRSPPVTAHIAHDPPGIGKRKQRAAEETLGRQEE